MNPEREFAIDVVQRLTEAGFQALWAGGCVRDALLGKTPKDYDVATTATPAEVIQLFGARRTLAVGESFGVVVVLGPRKAHGQIEVATFRRDGDYTDGRRPESVEFCDAEEDAKRRDFTINGMFFDPLSEQVIDYVGGQQDLQKRVVKAIGDPAARITEDKLRMLRAIRFAATFDFKLDTATKTAVTDLSDQLQQVSAERIAQESRRMLAHSSRSLAVRLLFETGLLSGIFPEVIDEVDPVQAQKVLSRLCEGTHEPTIACIYANDAKLAERACRRLKLSNEETSCITWLIESLPAMHSATEMALHVLKPLIADRRWPLLWDLFAATFPDDRVNETKLKHLAEQPSEVLNPPHLIDGSDLKQLGAEPGPIFKTVLTAVRNSQLDGDLTTPEEAKAVAKRMLAES